MNVQPILDRLRQTRPQHPDLSALRRLYRAWRHQVPYENFDLQLGRDITLDPDRLIDKFGRRRRGGTCFQMNTAMSLLLGELGFSISLVEGAVLREIRGDQQWGNHIALLAEVQNQTWLLDVGIGDSFLEPLPLVEGVHAQGAQTYRVEQLEPEIWRIHHHPQGSVTSWDIRSIPRSPQEFTAQAQLSSPALHKVLVAQRHRAGVELALRSRIVSRHGPKGKQQRVLVDYRDFTDTLTEDFGIALGDFTRQETEVLWERTAEQYQVWLEMTARHRTEPR